VGGIAERDVGDKVAGVSRRGEGVCSSTDDDHRGYLRCSAAEIAGMVGVGLDAADKLGPPKSVRMKSKVLCASHV